MTVVSVGRGILDAPFLFRAAGAVRGAGPTLRLLSSLGCNYQ